jgi:hypothetical protein
MPKFGEDGHVGGRPKGVRNRLSHEFITALLKDFEEGGAAALKVARLEDPLKYIAIVASLMPRELAVEHSQLGDLSDDEVNALLEYVREQRAKLIEHKPNKAPAITDKGPRVVGVLPTRNRRGATLEGG